MNNLPLRGKRIACTLPFAPENSGAWIRFSQFLEVLRDAGAHLSVIVHNRDSYDCKMEGADFHVWKTPFIFETANEALERLPEGAPLKQVDRLEAVFMLAHKRELYDLIEGYEAWVREICKDVDLVAIEYSIMGEFYASVCRDLNLPLIISQYDVLHQLHGASGAITDAFRRIEVEALQKADGVYCLAPGEQAIYQELGISSSLAPFTGRVQDLDFRRSDDELKKFLPSDLRNRPFGLFVGSNHPPNQAAASFILELAPHISGCNLVIAGDCVEKQRKGLSASVNDCLLLSACP